jgi:hypothetical protein
VEAKANADGAVLFLTDGAAILEKTMFSSRPVGLFLGPIFKLGLN